MLGRDCLFFSIFSFVMALFSFSFSRSLSFFSFLFLSICMEKKENYYSTIIKRTMRHVFSTVIHKVWEEDGNEDHVLLQWTDVESLLPTSSLLNVQSGSGEQ